MKIVQFLILVIIILSFAVGFYFYPQMPEKMASHWNAQGQVDGYISKFWGLFLMPIISLIIFLLFLLIPKIDPLKANIEKFRKYFDIFILLIVLFLLYLYLLTIFWNFGKQFNMIQVLMPAFAVLFYYAGILIAHAKRNWFVGIRTPWTLSSEAVWDKTHKIGSKLFKLAGIIIFFGIFFPNYAIWLLFAPLIIAALYPIPYSYFEYQKEKSK